MARGTVKWFNPAKGYNSFSPRAAAVARMFLSTFQLLSEPASAHSTRDKLSIRNREQSRKEIRGQPQDKMTVLMSKPAELSSATCRSCGACCSFSTEWPRFSLESEISLDQFRLYTWTTSAAGCDAMAIVAPPSWETSAFRRRARSTS